MSGEEAKAQALTLLKNMRYDQGQGYLWVNNTGLPALKMVMHPIFPEIEGAEDKKFYTADPRAEVPDQAAFKAAMGKNRHLLRALAYVAKTYNGGFVDYNWPHPDKKGSLVPKVSYVKYFAPWDWVIGTGVYIDDIEREKRNRIKAVMYDLQSVVSKVRLLESGYFYIFSGQKTMIVHPFYKNSQPSGLVNRATGNSIFDDLMHAYWHDGGRLVYLWDKPQNTEESFGLRR